MSYVTTKCQVQRLQLCRETGTQDAVLAYAKTTEALDTAHLSGPEQQHYKTFGHDRRRQSFLWGRYAAKVAVQALLPEQRFPQIDIQSGVFGQPILNVAQPLGVSISHTTSAVMALCYPLTQPMGIDIEERNRGTQNAIQSQLTDKELALIAEIKGNDDDLARLAFSSKEALSKILQTGMMTPFKGLALSQITQPHPAQLHALFERFHQYQVIAWHSSDLCGAIVLPKKTQISGQKGLPFTSLPWPG